MVIREQVPTAISLAELDLGRNSRFDLHMHTSMSDGQHSPDEVLQRCAAGRLDVVAITDHDLSGPLHPGLWQLDGRRVYLIAGAELTGVHEGREFHLLTYFPGPIPEEFRAFCQRQCHARARRYDAIIELLELDIPKAGEDAHDGDRALTSHHLAREIVARGFAGSRGEAFRDFIGPQRRKIPTPFVSLVEAISAARAHGGITSWAHPDIRDVERHIATLARAGLQGIEGLRPNLSRSDTRALRGLARRHGLFLTGGSDWHGWTEPALGGFGLEAQQLSGFLDALRAA